MCGRFRSGYDLAGIESETVDVVYCTVVFIHLEEWDRYNYIVEAFRVLRPGGGLLVDNVNLVSDAGWKFFEEHRKLPPTERPGQISKTSTPQEIETYFQRAGFEAIKQKFSDLWVFTFGVKPARAPAAVLILFRSRGPRRCCLKCEGCEEAFP
jgi:SAM-dependent methyltransferase